MINANLYEFGSHLIPLITSLQATDGPVLECGMGPISTPMLHWLCGYAPDRRHLTSLEEVPGWVFKMKEFESDLHILRHVGTWEAVLEQIKDTHFSVALIDTGAFLEKEDPYCYRKEIARSLADHTDVIVMHDINHAWFCEDEEWKDFVRGFGYIWEFSTLPNTTLVISNTTDVREFLKKELSDGN